MCERTFQGIQLLAPGTVAAFDVATRSLTMRTWWDLPVVLLDGALKLRHLPGMKEILRQGPSVGVSRRPAAQLLRRAAAVDRERAPDLRSVRTLAAGRT